MRDLGYDASSREIEQGDLGRGGKAHPRQISLQCCYIAGADDRADIPVRTNQNPFVGQQAVGLFEVSALVNKVAVRADDTDAQPRPRRENGTVGLMTDQ